MKTKKKEPENPQDTNLITTKVEGKENYYTEIYDWTKALRLFKSGGISHRALSVLKQERIKVAINNKWELGGIRHVVLAGCGYCFKYKVDYEKMSKRCHRCPIFKRNELKCSKLPEFKRMLVAITHKEMGDAHKEWCEKIGIGVYSKK